MSLGCFFANKLVNYINGELTAPKDNNYLDVYNPATGIAYTKVPESTAVDLDAAICSAKEAFRDWQKVSHQERAQWLRKLANGIEKYSNELAIAESCNTGKPISLAKNLDIARSAANFLFYADAITQFRSDCYSSDPNIINYNLKQPLGIVACISPWNLPLYLLTWKIAPALVTGNCVIAKPSEITPVTATLLAEICAEINFPKGVLSILHGSGNNIGNMIVEHQDISAISFTGGTQTGKKLAVKAAQNLKKVSLELGGKNPAIIFADCDLDKTIDIVVKSAFTNQGQVCLCNSRIYIQDNIYEKFKHKFIEKVADIKIGDPQDIHTQFGAISNKNHYEKILNYIRIAKEDGGSILYGGEPVTIAGRCQSGYFIKPTVIENIPSKSVVNQHEIFGPVITLNKFSTMSEAIFLANDTIYGLATSIFTNDINKANMVAREIKSGIVWINNWMIRDLRTPFGGCKDSGIGREGGDYSLNFFTENKNICITYG